jgi:hypothetical protein
MYFNIYISPSIKIKDVMGTAGFGPPHLLDNREMLDI